MSKLKYLKYLIHKDKDRMLPIYIILGVTYRCNSKCKTCFNWRYLGPSIENQLTLEEIEKICRGLGEVLFLVVTGGEPFLRKDLVEIIKLFRRINKIEQVTIPTNALLPETIFATTGKLLKECSGLKITINLSMDDLFDRHDQIRGVKGNFQQFLKTYHKLVLLKSENRNLKVNLNTVLCSYNKNNIKEIISFVKREMPQVDFHGFELLRGVPPVGDCQTLSIEEFETAIAQLKDYWFSFGSYSRFLKAIKIQSREVELEILKQKRQIYPCYAGWISGVINADGSVQLCEPLKSIGNLRNVNYNFSALWFSEEANLLRRLIKNKKCYCTHSCFISSSLAFCPEAYLDLAVKFGKDLLKSLKPDFDNW